MVHNKSSTHFNSVFEYSIKASRAEVYERATPQWNCFPNLFPLVGIPFPHRENFDLLYFADGSMNAAAPAALSPGILTRFWAIVTFGEAGLQPLASVRGRALLVALPAPRWNTRGLRLPRW